MTREREKIEKEGGEKRKVKSTNNWEGPKHRVVVGSKDSRNHVRGLSRPRSIQLLRRLFLIMASRSDELITADPATTRASSSSPHGATTTTERPAGYTSYSSVNGTDPDPSVEDGPPTVAGLRDFSTPQPTRNPVYRHPSPQNTNTTRLVIHSPLIDQRLLFN